METKPSNHDDGRHLENMSTSSPLDDSTPPLADAKRTTPKGISPGILGGRPFFRPAVAVSGPTSTIHPPTRFSLDPSVDFTAAWVSSSSFGPDPSLRYLAPKVATAGSFARASPAPALYLGNRSVSAEGGLGFVPPTALNLGRQWKQMGCQTRQYLQPTAPLPVSSRRIASAARHSRGTSLGGPPGSLSPLTPSKSWAQIVATSPTSTSRPASHAPGATVTDEVNTETSSGTQSSKLSSESAVKRRVPTFKPAIPRPGSRSSIRGISSLGVSTTSDASFKSLVLRLRMALDREKETWHPPRFLSTNTADNEVRVDGKLRDECVLWLAWILRKFRFGAETMSLATSLFDAAVDRVPLRSAKLLALVALHASAKFCEEDADVPSTKALLAVAEVDFTAEEASRLERLLLDEIKWDLMHRATPLKFLEILHTLVLCHQPQLLEDVALGLTPNRHLERLTWKMQRVVAAHAFLAYRPATVAIALLSLDLEAIDVPDWQLVTITLEKIARVDAQSFTRCRNAMVRFFGERRGMGEGGLRHHVTGAKLKRKHGISEPGIEASGSETTLMEHGEAKSGNNEETRVTLKRLFNAESPMKCKSEAMEEDTRVAPERYTPLRGLCINIY